jgi:hypothetical protein
VTLKRLCKPSSHHNNSPFHSGYQDIYHADK